jgi:diguanylate cyclase (GGDEF)-like protein
MLIDLDRFKSVNDTLGHAAGDRLLIEVAAVLRRECRTLDVCGRLGGDEFLVILPMTRPEEAMVFVSRVQAGFARLEQLHPEFGTCSASFGLAECPEHGTTVTSVMGAADAALYRAKRGGRNAVAVAVTEG